MLDIFGSLSGYKFKGAIAAGRFVKLASYEGMTKEGFSKIDYDLLFLNAMKLTG
jgi:hypothetical protein